MTTKFVKDTELMKQLNRAMAKLDDAKFIIERVYAEMSKSEAKP